MKLRIILVTILSLILMMPIFIFEVEGQASKSQDNRKFGIKEKGNEEEKRVALVIGNGKYKDNPLANPTNDARALAKALREVGFDVEEGIDLSKRQMEEKIRSFGAKIRNGGVGLFYFAGHGIQIRDRNYLIPVTYQIDKEQDVEYEAVDVGRVIAEMDSAGNRLNILILDACRNNPFGRSFRSSNSAKGLAQVVAPSGTLIAYATAPGSVASDNPDGQNGLYTQELLKYIKEPGIEIGKVFRLVRESVEAKSKKQQTPWESSSIKGEFYFVVKVEVTIKKEETNPTIDPKVIEQKYWETIDKTDIDELKTYLVKYPKGEYADLATARIKKLNNTTSKPVETTANSTLTNISKESSTASNINIDYIKQGSDLLNKGNTFEALRNFDIALKANPGNLGVYYLIGQAYHRQGNLSAALNAYKRCTPPAWQGIYSDSCVNQVRILEKKLK
ncbi:MAG: caspase family protein [Blastocatellia bacterium]